MAVEFYQCKKCKKIVEMIQGSSCPTVCCGDEMVLLKANTSDGATEKHVPVVNLAGHFVDVTIGSALHPMESDHWIQFIEIETNHGVQRKTLSPGDKPSAVFALADGDKVLAVYEFCNKHGLWKWEAQ
ncbi:desulfoferrodoxin family protein [Treponema zioleckii]|uniref:desulfoferrodoxin family protein n=1 Tax=Treponema zioleckii TaxID=331680 RepID=UPI00168A822D|nr:desulfoferrodoxin family protein [Treponema zioleckii]